MESITKRTRSREDGKNTVKQNKQNAMGEKNGGGSKANQFDTLSTRLQGTTKGLTALERFDCMTVVPDEGLGCLVGSSLVVILNNAACDGLLRLMKQTATL